MKPRKRWSSESWQAHGSWEDGRWNPGWRRKRGRLFLRFVAFFGFIALLFFAGLAVAAYLLTRFFGGDGQMAALVWILGCSLALALPLLAIGLSMRAFRRFATPLASVMEAADAVAEGDLSVRLPESGSRDFRQLAHSFNHMTQELEKAQRQRRNLTADVAHELRTPLHIIQGNLEGLLDGVYEPTGDHIGATLEETQLLARLVEDLQTLSLAEAAGITLELSLEALPVNLTVSADYGRLDQVLGNLMANALRHTPPGGSIRLEAESWSGGVRINLSDTGEGIPPEDLPYIFDRFWRGDPSRPHAGGSSGLGLAIAQQLVRAHDGRLTVVSKLGHGTTFTIELPAV